MDYHSVGTVLIGIILSLGLSHVTDAAKWGYVGETAPGYWRELFPDACAGQYQSPIDINTENTVYDPELRDFSIFFDPPLPGSKFVVLNNGHAVQVNTEGEFYVTNGGLRNVYRTAQFHFHWGHASHHGSEHTVNGKAAPIEMHIVSWNKDKYKSIGEAAVEPSGLAVLGILFEISPEDNLVLEPLVNTLMKIRDPEKKLKMEIPAVSMRNFLPLAPERYYRYNGSLTTPGCFESVVWTVFHEKQQISRRQLRVFRQVLKPKRRRHERSVHRDERVVRAVMEEIGIENNAKERYGFRRELETKKTDNSKEVYTVEENPPTAENNTHVHVDTNTAHGSHGNGMSGHETHASGPKPETVPSSAHDTQIPAEPVRSVLVNNFRPVQPLNGRTVYRSFPFFEPVHEKSRVVYIERERSPSSKDSAASTVIPSFLSLSILCLTRLI